MHEVSYYTEAQGSGKRFSIKSWVLRELGITGSDVLVSLVVRDNKTGKLLFTGTTLMHSGAEIYDSQNPDLERITPNQPLVVTVSKA